MKLTNTGVAPVLTKTFLGVRNHESKVIAKQSIKIPHKNQFDEATTDGISVHNLYYQAFELIQQGVG